MTARPSWYISGRPIAAEPRKTSPTRAVTSFSRSWMKRTDPPATKMSSELAIPTSTRIDRASTRRRKAKCTTVQAMGGLEAIIRAGAWPRRLSARV